jgi:hypothetical protein
VHTVRRQVLVRALLVSALPLIAFCERWENRYLKRSVTETEVVGQWRMTTASVDDLRRVGHADTIEPALQTITLRPGGTCHFSTFPTALTSQGQPNVRVDCECKWSLRNRGRQALLIDLATSPETHTHFYFGLGGSSQLVLWRNATDPDHELYVEYEREN